MRGGAHVRNRMDVVDERRHAAHARAHVDAQALAIDGAFDIKARIVHGFVRSRHRKLNARVQMLGVTLAKVLVAVKALTSAATLTVNASVSKCVIGPMPHVPAHMAAQVASAVLPSGDTAPMPVIATLCSIMVSSSKPFFGPGFYIAIPPSTRTTSPVM